MWNEKHLKSFTIEPIYSPLMTELHNLERVNGYQILNTEQYVQGFLLFFIGDN